MQILSQGNVFRVFFRGREAWRGRAAPPFRNPAAAKSTSDLSDNW